MRPKKTGIRSSATGLRDCSAGAKNVVRPLNTTPSASAIPMRKAAQGEARTSRTCANGPPAPAGRAGSGSDRKAMARAADARAVMAKGARQLT